MHEAIEASKDLGFPLVIKPADNMGGRGVQKIEDHDDIEVAFRSAKSAATRGELIIEEYLPGKEFSTDSLFYDGELVHQVIADRIIEKEPYFIETGHVLPSQKDPATRKKILELASKAAQALGIDTGAAKGDIKMTPDGPKMVEMAARLSGGFMSGYTYPLATGQSIIKNAILIALGEKPNCPVDPVYNRVVIERALLPEPGEIRDITGHEKLLEINGVEEIFINSEIGQKVKKPKSNLDKPANIIVSGANFKNAWKISEKALQTLKFNTGPPPELDMQKINNRARNNFQGACAVCPHCDGVHCAGEVPGVGGVGSGASFQENLRSLEKWKINCKYIQNTGNPQLGFDLWGTKLDFPVLAAPITGVKSNMNSPLTEEQYARAVACGSRQAGTIAMLGDGASTHKYKIGLAVLSELDGWGIPIFKPRLNHNDVERRIKRAEDCGAVAVGMDIDAIQHPNMEKRSQNTRAYNREQLKKLIKNTNLKFIVKGIMSIADARKAADAGADAIVVSNHGGRILDQQPGVADVLPEIADAVKEKVLVFADGGIRSGVDVFKCLALGADAVLIGRPVMIAAVGGEADGVEFYLHSIKTELRKALLLTATTSVTDVPRNTLYKL
ncbi:MAG: alpha-hydroxy-acid oxidizing protein [bacterium]